MRIRRSVLAALLLILPGIVFGEGALPPDAENLKTKLEDWESERQKELAAEIQKKRAEVIAALQKHLQSATQGGDLDGALAIRKLITQLSGEVVAAESGADSVMTEAVTQTSLDSRINGSIWTWYVPNHKLHILESGEVDVVKEEGGTIEFSWEEVDAQTIRLVRRKGGQEFATIKFDSRFRKAVSKLKTGRTNPLDLERIE